MTGTAFAPAIFVYGIFTRVLAPVLPLLLRRRLKRGKEHATRWREKMGHAGRARPHGPLVWIHAASVGESLSVLPLIEVALARRPDANILVTTGTVTSAQLLEQRLPARAFHQFAPLDAPRIIRRFLSYWKPDLVLWVESELWPNTLRALEARSIATVLINARLSDRSFARWQRWPRMTRVMLRTFSLGLAPTRDMATRLTALGMRRVKVVGNLKGAADVLAHDESALASLRAEIGARPVFVAASTHEGEDAMIAAAIATARITHEDLLSIVVPRHPERGEAVAQHFQSAGLGVAQRSKGEAITDSCAVYVADTIGELGLFYRVSDVVFMGGSHVSHGGQNPFEAARLERAVAHGPHVFNFREAYGALHDAGAAVEAADAGGLADYIIAQIRDRDLAQRMGEAAAAAANTDRDALNRSMAYLVPFLKRLGHYAVT